MDKPQLITTEANSYPRLLRMVNQYKRNFYFGPDLNKRLPSNSLSIYGNILIKFMYTQSYVINTENYECSIVAKVVSDQIPPLCIMDLIKQYLYNRDDQLYCFVYTLYVLLTKLRKYSISERMLQKLIKHYLVPNHVHDNQTQKLVIFYFQKVLQLKFLVVSNKSHTKLFQFPLELRLRFASIEQSLNERSNTPKH